MAHPFQAHRQHKVERERVPHIARGYASGGAVHDDEAADEALIKKEVKSSALKKAHGGKIDGKAAKARLDRGSIKRARGGKVGKKKAGTNVNIVVAPHPGGAAQPPASPAGIGAAAPMVPPPRPPMPPMAGPPGMPPGMPPGGPPPMMRAKGGRVGVEGEELGTAKATGVASTSKVGKRPKNGPAWAEGLRNGTQISHTPGNTAGASMAAHEGVKKVRTYATGGSVKGVSKDEPPAIKVGEMGLSASKSNPFPKMKHAAGGGLGRLEKVKKAVRGVSAP